MARRCTFRLLLLSSQVTALRLSIPGEKTRKKPDFYNLLVGGFFSFLHPIIPLSPTLDPPIDLRHRHPVSHQLHHDPQLLHVFIPTLIVEEQHLLVRQTRSLVQTPEMRRLRPRVDLHVIEQIDRPRARS